MATATWKHTLIADAAANDVVVVEGNVYFPIGSARRQHLQPSDHQTVCPWKGTAHYYDVVVDGEVNKNAAWYYPEPKDAAKQIAGRVAFWKGVDVIAQLMASGCVPRRTNTSTGATLGPFHGCEARQMAFCEVMC